MKVRWAALVVVLGSAVGLSACWDSADLVVHEAGEYKGQEDPLLELATSREEELRKRFQLVQVDR